MSAVAYDKKKGQLEITFRGGARYRYLEVSEQVWKMLKKTSSVGRFVRAYVKGVYVCEKVQSRGI